MNLFPEQPTQSKEDLYFEDIKKKAYLDYDKYVSIRIEVRKLIANFSDKKRLELCKEILKTERSNNDKIRKEYYKNIFKQWDELKSHPDN